MNKNYRLSSNPAYVQELRDGSVAGCVSVTAPEYVVWIEAGNTPLPEFIPPQSIIYKEKNSIITQLIAAGKMPSARAILASPGMEDSRDLWDGAYKIAYDDAAVRGLLTAVGMDAEDVMSKATTFGG